MAERLTEIGMFIDTPVYIIKNGKKSEAVDKLAQLENILEKYDLEVEELDERIYNGAFNYIDKLKAETDRDTWKRACELACEREDDCYVYDNIHRAYEFYQQAKKESENNDTNN